MTEDNPKIAVIATRMPYIDRRSLSEAWFSALHFASDGPVRRFSERRDAASHRETIVRRAGSACRAESTPAMTSATQPSAPRTSRPATAPAPMQSAASRAAAVRGPLSRARSYAPFFSSLTFGVHGERVALSLRRDGGTLYVVAVCRPHVEGIVRRALACADVYLRLRGESIRATVNPVRPEAGE